MQLEKNNEIISRLKTIYIIATFVEIITPIIIAIITNDAGISIIAIANTGVMVISSPLLYITEDVYDFEITGKIVTYIVNLFLRKDKIVSPYNSKLLKLTAFLYQEKIQREVFVPIVADWQEEYFEALFKKEIRKARWINVRYTYAFLAAMWMKSPIGDLIEFVLKIAKL